MSSLRNSLHRRNHKERSQLSHRTRFGFLEKHKDYVLRARDYHSKQARLQRLRQKAAERNRDEFYFAMNSQRTKGGVHVQDRGNQALPTDMVKVLKTQDENYVRTMRTAGLKKIDKLKHQLSALADLVKPASEAQDDGTSDMEEQEMDALKEAGIIQSSKGKRKARPAKHIVFVDDEAAVRQYSKSSKAPETELASETPAPPPAPVDLGWKVVEEKKSRKGKQKQQNDEQPEEEVDDAAGIERRQAVKENRKRLLKELSARLTRDRQLRYAGRELEMQRLLMGKGGRRKIRGVEKVEADDNDEDEDSDDDVARDRRAAQADKKEYRPRVYKWRMERKR